MRHVARAPWDTLLGHVARAPWDMLRGLHETCCEGSMCESYSAFKAGGATWNWNLVFF